MGVAQVHTVDLEPTHQHLSENQHRWVVVQGELLAFGEKNDNGRSQIAINKMAKVDETFGERLLIAHGLLNFIALQSSQGIKNPSELEACSQRFDALFAVELFIY